MRAGQLRELLNVQTATHTRDGLGEDIETWSNSFTAYASIMPSDGRKYIHGEQNTFEISHEITVRHDSRITQAARLQHPQDGRIFNIVRVLNVGERDVRMLILAKEEI